MSKGRSSFPLRSNEKKMVESIATQFVEKTIASTQDADNAADVLQRNLVVDLGAHTDSETDTASKAE